MKKFLSLILAVGLSFSLVACGEKNENETQNKNNTENAQNSSESMDVLDKILESKQLIIGTSPDYAPYEFKIVEDGKEKTVGFDIDISNEIAKDLGVELKIVETNLKGILLDLENGNIDLGMAALSPTPEREKTIDFSDIYYTSTQSILVDAKKVDEFKDLSSFSNKKVGVQSTSIQEQIAKEQMPDAKLITLEKLPQIILDLNGGNIDAAILETPVAEGYVKQFPNLAIAKVTVPNESNGSAIAVKKGNPKLLEAVNKTIKRLKDEGLIEQFVINSTELMQK